MNGRHARALRKQAGGNLATYIQGKPPVYFDISQMPNAPIGIPPTFIKQDKGIPTRLAPCSRQRYQLLKRGFNASIH